MEQSDFDFNTTRVRHLREKIVELQKNYDQLTLNVKNQERQILPTQVLLLRKRFIKVNHYKDSSTSGVKEGEIGLRSQKSPKRVDTTNEGVTSCCLFNNTWENLLKGMEFRPEHYITDVSEKKYPRLWALKGADPNDVSRWYNFGALASIRTIAPCFREILELPNLVLNAVAES
ncbi:hypothetical protein ACS0TY_027120 [Phlomoides rotata]